LVEHFSRIENLKHCLNYSHEEAFRTFFSFQFWNKFIYQTRLENKLIFSIFRFDA